jgi:hypothetical protein
MERKQEQSSRICKPPRLEAATRARSKLSDKITRTDVNAASPRNYDILKPSSMLLPTQDASVTKRKERLCSSDVVFADHWRSNAKATDFIIVRRLVQRRGREGKKNVSVRPAVLFVIPPNRRVRALKVGMRIAANEGNGLEPRSGSESTCPTLSASFDKPGHQSQKHRACRYPTLRRMRAKSWLGHRKPPPRLPT